MRTLHKALQHLLTFGLIAALSSSCSAQAKKERFTRRADEYFKAGDYEKAKLEYMNSIRIDERDPEPYERLGTIWLDEGAPLRGLPFLARAKELAPARAAIRAKLAELFMALSSLEDARKEALEALQIDPANDDALFVLADAARTPEDVAEVEQEVNRANRRESVKLQLSRASIAARKNDSGAMEAALSSAVAADPKSPVAHMALGRLRQFQNKKEEAAKEFKLAAEAAPPRSTAHLQYAEFLAQNGSTDEAIAYLNEIVRKAPDFLSAWVLLARFTAPKNPDNAIAFLDNVFRRDPQNLDARMMESDLYAKKGEVKRSVEILRQLDAAYPKVPLIKFQLSRALSQTGDIQHPLQRPG